MKAIDRLGDDQVIAVERSVVSTGARTSHMPGNFLRWIEDRIEALVDVVERELGSAVAAGARDAEIWRAVARSGHGGLLSLLSAFGLGWLLGGDDE